MMPNTCCRNCCPKTLTPISFLGIHQAIVVCNFSLLCCFCLQFQSSLINHVSVCVSPPMSPSLRRCAALLLFCCSIQRNHRKQFVGIVAVSLHRFIIYIFSSLLFFFLFLFPFLLHSSKGQPLDDVRSVSHICLLLLFPIVVVAVVMVNLMCATYGIKYNNKLKQVWIFCHLIEYAKWRFQFYS